MPVSSKKQDTETFVASVTDFQDSSTDDFICDPDQFRDQLPQPYRCVDKVLLNLIDCAWEIISKRECERIREASKVRAPQYQCSVKIEEHSDSTTLSSTPDGQYIIVGLSTGLAVVATSNQNTVSLWDQPMHIKEIEVAPLTDGWFTILTLDEEGVSRLFALAREQLFLLHTFNEVGGNGNGMAEKHALSLGSEYVSLFISSSESYIEVYKSPVDVWISELEAIVGPAKKAEVPPPQDGEVSEHTDVDSEVTGTNEAGSVAPDAQNQSQRSEVFSRSALKSRVSTASPKKRHSGQNVRFDAASRQSTLSVKSNKRGRSPAGSAKGRNSPAVHASNHKFSAANAILRIRPPIPLQGVNWSSPYQLSKTVDGSGDVIGTGSNHMMSTQHLEQRQNMFEALHQPHMKYLPEEIPQTPIVPTFHFLRPGQSMLHSTDRHLQAEPTSICVWWSGHPQICHYSLLKTAKELEHKADLVWPQSKDIICSAISTCSALLAVATTDNVVVIWDRYLGLIRRVVHIDTDSRLQKLTFLDPSVCPQSHVQYPPYGTHTNSYLMCVCENSQIYLVTCRQGDNTPPTLICDIPEKEFENLTMVEPICGLPELTVICRADGGIYIQETLTGHVICQVTLPEGYEMTSAINPLCVASSNGKMLYLKGKLIESEAVNTTDINQSAASFNQEEEEEDAEDLPSCEENLFVFQLRSFPTLDRYHMAQRPQIPFVIHNTVENRVVALLRERVTEQSLRHTRLQTRWGQLQGELQSISKMREQQISKSAHRIISAASVVKSIPISDASPLLMR